ncbi:dephospho-CoA kinase [Candidatus Sumerlaeota bacterium]|nr:dephospho-CoA kinase [Candidatus Sumerlaeota bacterium]
MSYILGLTGTMGSGKTFVASLFSLCNAVVIDADTLARDAVLPGTPAFKEIAGKFGPGILSADGAIDRARLARIVFTDPSRRIALENIIHPVVRQRTLELIAEAASSPLVVLDVPLLFESGMEKECTATAVVTVDEENRAKRMKTFRGISEPDLVSRMKAQWSQEKKASLADFIIDNSGSRRETVRQVDVLLDQIFPSGIPSPLTKTPLQKIS